MAELCENTDTPKPIQSEVDLLRGYGKQVDFQAGTRMAGV